MRDIRAVKIIYDDGLIEDVPNCIILIEDGGGFLLEGRNIDPMKQVAYLAMALDELISELFNVDNGSSAHELSNTLRALASYMYKESKQQTKGEVIQ